MSFELRIIASTERYEPEDERWLRQVAELYAELRAETRTAPVPGAKGGTETVIVALGSAGALTAAVQAFQGWLRRDRGRSLELTWTEDGVEHKLTARGEALDGEPFKALAEAVAARLGKQ